MTFAPPSPASPVTPLICPFCRSVQVTTTTGTFDASGYWRCEKCGEMWNVGRLHETNRYRDKPRWR